LSKRRCSEGEQGAVVAEELPQRRALVVLGRANLVDDEPADAWRVDELAHVAA
jgi:hypothetical protein